MKVYRAFRRNGNLAQVALSEAQIVELCPESRRRGWRIVATDEDVASATGIVHDWSRGGGCGGLHVHWLCPLCSKEHYSDFDANATISNPVLWLCESGSGAVCLVHWQHEQIA
jgi:hypothetical protein